MYTCGDNAGIMYNYVCIRPNLHHRKTPLKVSKGKAFVGGGDNSIMLNEDRRYGPEFSLFRLQQLAISLCLPANNSLKLMYYTVS